MWQLGHDHSHHRVPSKFLLADARSKVVGQLERKEGEKPEVGGGHTWGRDAQLTPPPTRLAALCQAAAAVFIIPLVQVVL